MDALIAFFTENPELVSALAAAATSLFVALTKRFGGERFHLVRELGRRVLLAASAKK